MPYTGRNRFASEKVEWETPDSLFRPLDEEFGFTLDVCASGVNAKCPTYYTREDDALAMPWTGVCWMNPPYGPKLADWVRKARRSAEAGATVVCLLPVRTNTGYWHEEVFGHAEVRFLRGYPRFGGAKQGIKAPLAVVIFEGGREPCIRPWPLGRKA